MDLVPYAEDDLPLTVALECDPAMMAELGGPVPLADMPRVHQRRLEYIANGNWCFKIVPHPGLGAAGTIGVWDSSWQGTPIYEIGWMVLPGFQGRGLATEAARLIVERARAQQMFLPLHAFPGLNNAPSNAICRRLGFENLGPCQVEFRDRSLPCNHWRLDS